MVAVPLYILISMGGFSVNCGGQATIILRCYQGIDPSALVVSAVNLIFGSKELIC